MAREKFEVIPWKFDVFPTYVCVYRGDGGMIMKSRLIDEYRLTDVEFVEDSEFPGPVSKRNRDKAIQALHDAGYVVVLAADDHGNMPDRSPLRESADEAMALARIKAGKGE
jgi:hypothetical protein